MPKVPSASEARGEHAEGAGQHGRLVGEDVAEHVLAEDHVELLRPLDQLHGGVVDVHVGQFHIRIFLGDAGDDLAPEHRGGEDVGLVDGADLLAALAGRLEGDMGDALDLRHAVAHGVDADPLAPVPFDPLRLGEVDAAGQFADHQDIEAAAR